VGGGQFVRWQRTYQDRAGIEIEISKFGELIERSKKDRFLKKCRMAEVVIFNSFNYYPFDYCEYKRGVRKSMAEITKEIFQKNPKTRVSISLFMGVEKTGVYLAPRVEVHFGFCEYEFFPPILAEIVEINYFCD